MTGINHHDITDVNGPRERVLWRLTDEGVATISLCPPRSQRTTVKLYEGELWEMYNDLEAYFGVENTVEGNGDSE